MSSPSQRRRGTPKTSRRSPEDTHHQRAYPYLPEDRGNPRDYRDDDKDDSDYSPGLSRSDASGSRYSFDDSWNGSPSPPRDGSPSRRYGLRDRHDSRGGVSPGSQGDGGRYRSPGSERSPERMSTRSSARQRNIRGSGDRSRERSPPEKLYPDLRGLADDEPDFGSPSPGRYQAGYSPSPGKYQTGYSPSPSKYQTGYKSQSVKESLRHPGYRTLESIDYGDRYGDNPYMKRGSKTDDPLEAIKAYILHTIEGYHIHLCCGLVVMLMIFALWFVAWPSTPDQPEYTDRQKLVRDYMGKSVNLRDQFPSQEETFWREVLVPIKNVLGSPQPSRPAVIMLGTHGRDVLTAHCIAKRLAKCVADTFNRTQADYTLEINARNDFKYQSGDQIKERLDDTLVANFQGGRRVVMLSHLEALPWQAASMLHSYCDHENAPYKDAIFLASVEIPDDQHLTSLHVEDFLEKQWSGYGVDNIKALFSRIANHIVIVKHEKDSYGQCP